MSEIFIKKKKKRSFAQIAKKRGRQNNGFGGKENPFSEEEYNFFITVYQHIKDPEFEEKELILQKFFGSIENESTLKWLVSDQFVSKILNEVLPIAKPEKLLYIMEIISVDLRIHCTDPYASHVLQTLLVLGLTYTQPDAHVKCSNEDLVKITEDNRKKIMGFLCKVSKFVYNNINEFINETYASHVLRSVIEVCSGVEIDSAVKSGQKVQTTYSIQQDSTKKISVPPELLQIVNDLLRRIALLPNFLDVVCSESGSPTIQVALLVLHALGEKKTCKHLIKTVMEQGFKQLPESHSGIHSVFETNSTCRLLEVILYVSSGKRQAKIFKFFFEEKIPELVKHRLGNFAIQKLLSTWKLRDTFSKVFDPVAACLADALQFSYFGVVHALVHACFKLSANQASCMKILLEYFQCQQSHHTHLKIVPCLLYFLTLPKYGQARESSETLKVSLHGSLIIQDLLQFRKPITVVLSILEMNLTDLQLMACDPRGSRIIDSFVDSPFVGEKNKEKLIFNFKGAIANLACSMHGSRSLDALWRIANMNSKAEICTELLKSSCKVMDNNFGKIMYKKFQVGLFKLHDKSDWEKLILQKQKKRQLLMDILTDVDPTVTIPKKKKRQTEDVSEREI